jgi:lipopolysaccharide export system protein LptC
VNAALWLIATLASLALFIWLVSLDSSRPDDAVPLEGAAAPDLRMQRATVTQYGDDGTLRYQLQATEIRHFEADAITQLNSPTLTLSRTPQSSWMASARHGTVEHASGADIGADEVVTLRDDVHLIARDSRQNFELTCSRLYIYPARRFAETDEPVIIDAASGRTTAAGLSGDLDSGLLKLASSATQRVKTVVLPGETDWNQPLH